MEALPYLTFPGFIKHISVKQPPLLARLFGKRKRWADGPCMMTFLWWRGTVYALKEKDS